MARILVITNFYPPHGYGGYEGLCETAVSGLRARGHEVTVLCSDARLEGVPAGDDATVRRSLPVYWRDSRPTAPPVWQRLAWEWRSRRIVGSTLAELVPDVVSVWNLAALPFGILEYVGRRGVPVVAVLGDRWLTHGPQADAWSRLFVRRGRLGRAAGAAISAATGLATVPPRDLDVTALFCSRYLATETRRSSPFNLPRVAIVRNGVDLATFPLRREREETGWSGQLLVVGRIHPTKGVATAIRALAELPSATLRIAGAEDDAHLAELESLAAALGVSERVHFLGQCAPDRVRSLYGEADALLFTSEWEEPFGLVPLEAMASGTPVVGTGTGGSGEFLVDEETCLRCPPGDPAALAAAVRRLAADATLRSHLRSNGLDTAARMSHDRMIDTLESWHLAAADGFERGRPN